MASEGRDGHVFRFMDLPLEIRDQIYGLLLCGFPAPEYPDDDFSAYGFKQSLWLNKSLISASILRVNRQIYEEALAVVIRKNLFVQVECRMDLARSENLQMLMRNLGLPMVAGDAFWTCGSDAPVDIDGCQPLLAMTYIIGSGNLLPTSWSITGPLRFVILHRELEELLIELAVADEAGMIDFLTKMTHQVTIHTYKDTTKHDIGREFLGTEAVLERLLAPFSKHYKGVKKFSIRANSFNEGAINALDAQVMASTISSVRHKPQKTVPEMLAEARQLKDKGTALFKARKMRKASKDWTRAVSFITQARRRPDFAGKYVSKPQHSPERQCIREMSELSFQLHLKLTQLVLVQLQAACDHNVNNRSGFETISKAALMYLQGAGLECSFSTDAAVIMPASSVENDNDITGGWRPTNTQVAKLFYRFAKVHRFREEWEDGTTAIELAQVYAPTDATIRAEAAAIFNLSG